jgi:hypothetical protein
MHGIFLISIKAERVNSAFTGDHAKVLTFGSPRPSPHPEKAGA